MNTHMYDSIRPEQELHIGTAPNDVAIGQLVQQRRVTFASFAAELLHAISTLRVGTNTPVHIACIRYLWRKSCEKLLTPIPHMKDFHPSALMGHLGLTRVLVNELESRAPYCALAGSEQDRVQTMLLHLAWNLSAYVENKLLLVRDGIVPALCRILDACTLAGTSSIVSGRGARSTERCISAILQNVSERRFRHGEVNPMQLRVAAEGGLSALVQISTLPAWASGPGPYSVPADADMSVSIISLMGAANLSLHPANRATFAQSGALEALRTLVDSGLLLNDVATADAFDGWLSLLPMVPLLSSPFHVVRSFGLQCLARATQEEKYTKKLWKDFALVDGLEPLRRLARRSGRLEGGGTGVGARGVAEMSRCTDRMTGQEQEGEPDSGSQVDADNDAIEDSAALQSTYNAVTSEDAELALLVLDRMNAVPGQVSILQPQCTLATDLGRLIGVTTGEALQDLGCQSAPAGERSQSSLQRGAPLPAVGLSPALFSDVSFTVGDGLACEQCTFPAHRVILAARVPALLVHFVSDFGRGSQQAQSGAVIHLPDVHPSGFRVLLEWAYTGQIGGLWHNQRTDSQGSAGAGSFTASAQGSYAEHGGSVLDPDSLLHGLVTADRFDVPALRAVVEEAAAQGVDPTNAQAILDMADTHRAYALAAHCRLVLQQEQRVQAMNERREQQSAAEADLEAYRTETARLFQISVRRRLGEPEHAGNVPPEVAEARARHRGGLPRFDVDAEELMTLIRADLAAAEAVQL